MTAANLDPKQRVLEPPFDVALRLGLKPYDEYKKKMDDSKVFKRITLEVQERFLRDIYELAAKKVLMENATTATRELATTFREAAEKVKKAVPIIEEAEKQLSAAVDILPEDMPESAVIKNIITHLDDINSKLAEDESGRRALMLENLEGKEIMVWQASPSSIEYAVELRKMAEVDPGLPNGDELVKHYINRLTNGASEAHYRYETPCGTPLSMTDYWLISAIEEYLPQASPHKKSRFSKDALIKATFWAALGTIPRDIKGIKTARRRVKKGFKATS